MNYFLVTSRASLAFLTVHFDGNATYTNRRGDTFGVSPKHLTRLIDAGYVTPEAREVGPNGTLVKQVTEVDDELHAAHEELLAAVDAHNAQFEALVAEPVLSPAEKGKLTKARNKDHAEALLLNAARQAEKNYVTFAA